MGSVIASGGGKHFKENPVNRAMCSGDVKGNDCQRAVGRPWGMSLSTFHKEASVVRQEQKSGFRDEEVRKVHRTRRIEKLTRRRAGHRAEKGEQGHTRVASFPEPSS